MKIADPSQTQVVNEVALMQEILPLASATVLELGCGKAEKTRQLASNFADIEIWALEVDEIQHQRNLAMDVGSKLHFLLGGAESIPLPEASVDIVLMFKSLHHVPLAMLDKAMNEIARVLRPGGLAWISEPVYAGDLNEVFRLFHDEKQMREAAFAAICQAVESGLLVSKKQLFFNTRSYFETFSQFDQRMIQVTHTHHQLEPALYQLVKRKFESFMTEGGATFFNPQRVDLLQKPA